MDKHITIIGYGTQGKAWAFNLKDSGFNVAVALRKNSPNREIALKNGFEVIDFLDLKKFGPIYAVLIPDHVQGDFFKEYQKEFKPNSTIIFAHGFSVHYNLVKLPANLNTVLIAPKAIGPVLMKKQQIPIVVGVHNDHTKKSWDIVNFIAKNLSPNCEIIKSTFKEETEINIFVEHALTCGGIYNLINKTQNILENSGYNKKISQLETIKTLKTIVDMINDHGLDETYKKISKIALFATQKSQGIFSCLDEKLEDTLNNIKKGEFAKEFLGE